MYIKERKRIENAILFQISKRYDSQLNSMKPNQKSIKATIISIENRIPNTFVKDLHCLTKKTITIWDSNFSSSAAITKRNDTDGIKRIR
jgi:hypothetical protein